MIQDVDLKHLERCIELAKNALEAGDEPFGSILVNSNGEILAEEQNRVSGGDHTQHPEFALARWAAQNMSLEERGSATVTLLENTVQCVLQPMDGLGLEELFTLAHLNS